MLNESIKEIEGLGELTESQIGLIVGASKKDEDSVIRTKIGETLGRFDDDAKKVFGESYNKNGRKTHDVFKEDIFPKAIKFDSVKSELDTANTEITTLKKAIEEGSDDSAIKQQLADANSKIEQMGDVHSQALKDKDLEISKTKDSLLEFKISSSFDKDTSNMSFKDESIIDLSTRQMAIDQSKINILAKYNSEVGEDGKLVYRDKLTNEIALNPDNGLKPMTSKDLLLKEPYMKNVIDLGRSKEGAGSKEGGQRSDVLDVSSAKTQIEADEMISVSLMKKGLANGTKAFEDEHSKIRKENKVVELPVG